MALSVRYYLLDNEGTLHRISKPVVENLLNRSDRVEKYRSSKQKVVEVYVDNERGKPQVILDARGSFWDFDEAGYLNINVDHVFDLIQPRPSINKNDKVINLAPELNRQEIERKHRWNVTAEILDRIAADILAPKNDEVDGITSVKGNLPKAPPLTHDARRALTEIGQKINSISFDLSKLSEPALKGLAYEASRNVEYDEETALWKGIAEECNRRIEIFKRHRKGNGVWYAVVELFHKDGPLTSSVILTEHVKCANKKEAIEAGRNLLKSHADKFDADITVQVDIYSELEWTPSDWI